MVIAGWASTPDWDTQGESVDPIGIDADYFKQAGWIDYEHDTNDVIGYPTGNTFTDPNQGLYVEAKLFKSKPHVQSILNLYSDIQGTDRENSLGFSIEGQVKERDEENPRIIKSVWITGVAVTKNPSNMQATWELLQKSNTLEAGYGLTPDDKTTVGALMPESLSAKVSQLSYGLQNLDMPRLTKLTTEAMGILNNHQDSSPLAKVILLQVTTGLSRLDAIKEVAKQHD